MPESIKTRPQRSILTPSDWRSDWIARAMAGTRLITLLFLLISLQLGVLGVVQAQQNLPDMGEPADNVLSPTQEKELGRQFMSQIRANLPLQNDTQINEYIQYLGNRLAASAQSRHLTAYNFFILDDKGINAFAIPGGYVGVNAGLIDAMTREEQLAGVLAHEVAHLTQRHHARAFESAGKNRMSTAAAILAAIIIGTSSPEAGQAALAAGLAISQQSAINYTRAHEYEADRIGIQILSKANYDPEAIAETFEIMRRKNSINSSGIQIEYLRTHPLDSNRIAEARSRAGQLPAPTGEIRQIDFKIIQARLKVVASRDDSRLQSEYKAQFDSNNSAAAGYALAMLAIKSKKFELAEGYSQKLNSRYPDNPYLQLLAGQIAFGKGELAKSEAVYEQLLSIYPSRFSIVEQYSEQLVSQRKLQKTRRLIRHYQRSNTNPHNRAWRILANVQEKLGDRSGSHESLAQFFYHYGYLASAEGQIKMALREVDTGSQDELRLRARLKEFQKQSK